MIRVKFLYRVKLSMHKSVQVYKSVQVTPYLIVLNIMVAFLCCVVDR